MSTPEDRDKEPFDWFGKFFGRGSSRRSGGFFGFPDVFRVFDEVRREMETHLKIYRLKHKKN